MKETSANFSDFISKNYTLIKKTLKKGLPTYKFNEDLFHDTLLKCIDINKEMNDKEMLNYIFMAFKTNLYRETLYMRNILMDGITDEEYNIPIFRDETPKIDLIKIYEILKVNFDSTEILYFKKWTEGYSVREIEELEHTNGITYKINRIRKFIKDKILLGNYL